MKYRCCEKELLDDLPPYMYIVSEGTKTEPNYIKGFADAINAKYYEFSSGPRILVKGTGRNTKGLLRAARAQVENEFPYPNCREFLAHKVHFCYNAYIQNNNYYIMKTGRR